MIIGTNKVHLGVGEDSPHRVKSQYGGYADPYDCQHAKPPSPPTYVGPVKNEPQKLHDSNPIMPCDNWKVCDTIGTSGSLHPQAAAKRLK